MILFWRHFTPLYLLWNYQYWKFFVVQYRRSKNWFLFHASNRSFSMHFTLWSPLEQKKIGFSMDLWNVNLNKIISDWLDWDECMALLACHLSDNINSISPKIFDTALNRWWRGQEFAGIFCLNIDTNYQLFTAKLNSEWFCNVRKVGFHRHLWQKQVNL